MRNLKVQTLISPKRKNLIRCLGRDGMVYHTLNRPIFRLSNRGMSLWVSAGFLRPEGTVKLVSQIQLRPRGQVETNGEFISRQRHSVHMENPPVIILSISNQLVEYV